MSSNGNKVECIDSGRILPRCISLVLVLTPLIGAVLVLGALLWIGVPAIYRSMVPNEHGLLPASVQEQAEAASEHNAILWLAENCVSEKNGRSDKIVDEPFFHLESDQLHAVNLAAVRDVVELPGYFDAALYLSYAMGAGRSQLAGQAVTQHLIVQMFEWTIVATGLFTTILISVKAFASPRSRDYLLMAVAAIGLSSFSTAVATLNSFYTPRIEYEKTERSLASLRTLHRTLATGITREKHACDGKTEWTDWRASHIRELANDFIAIMSTTARPSAASENQPVKSDPNMPPNGPPRPYQNPPLNGADHHTATTKPQHNRG
jgi:hypothetical protein